jgi:diguanylate cyclase (GGDEF)-like protein
VVVLVMPVNVEKVLSKIIFLGFVLAALFVNNQSLANEIDDFIVKSRVKTYDCPVDSIVPQLETYLQNGDVSPSQVLDLKVIKSQWLICIGQYIPANTLLHDIITEPNIDKSSYSYASAIYQIAFILDIQEEPKRCRYFKQAEELGRQQFNDVFLSAQLGQITSCGQNNQDIGLKLGKLFALLESFVLINDQEAVAHIHNSIGLLYGNIGQNALAAEQYEKAYEIGLSVYEEKNQAAPLISIISAYIGSGDFDNAKRMIDELAKANTKVNTPLTNAWLYFAQSRYFYMTNDYESMRSSLSKWLVFLPQVSDKQMDALYAWYTTALCIQDHDKNCVEQFIQDRAVEDDKHASLLSNNKDYLRFLVEANLYLGKVADSQEIFARYADKLTNKLNRQQSSARVLGVAKLHNEIIALEADIAKIQRQHIQTLIMILLLLAVFSSLAYFTVGRRYLRKLATDSLTGLRNEQSILSEIKRVKSAVSGKINAIAVFDVTNFSEVNSQFGYLTGDALLKKVASCLTQVTRERDLVGRLGADRFIVCLKNIDDDTAKVLFERIQNVLAEMVFNAGSGEKVNVHSSMSMYLAADGFQDIGQVLEEIRMSFNRNKKTTVT